MPKPVVSDLAQLPARREDQVFNNRINPHHFSGSQPCFIPDKTLRLGAIFGPRGHIWFLGSFIFPTGTTPLFKQYKIFSVSYVLKRIAFQDGTLIEYIETRVCLSLISEKGF